MVTKLWDVGNPLPNHLPRPTTLKYRVNLASEHNTEITLRAHLQICLVYETHTGQAANAVRRRRIDGESLLVDWLITSRALAIGSLLKARQCPLEFHDLVLEVEELARRACQSLKLFQGRSGG
jgi:hypothetical protein